MSGARSYGVIDLALAASLRSVVVRLEPPQGVSLLDQATYLDVVPVGPWLIDLDACPQMRRRWIKEVRNLELGYTITTDLDLAALRRHLRKFALAEVEGQPKPVLFRYFDARIIRRFLLDIFTPQERQVFLGPMHCLEVRGEGGKETLVFQPEPQQKVRWG